MWYVDHIWQGRRLGVRPTDVLRKPGQGVHPMDVGMKPKSKRRFSAPLAAFFAVVLIAGPAFAGWQRVKRDDGVTVYMKENRRSGLPIVRVTTRIDANIAEVLAVLSDIDKACKWAGRCAEARILKQVGPFRHRIYQRRSGPWPVSDRDFELATRVMISKHGKEVTLKFRNVKAYSIKPKDGVVRMPTMRGQYVLRWAGPNVTEYDFRVEADPGGWIPRWVYKWAARSGPFDSARALRKRVPKVRGQYKAFVTRFDAIAASMKKPRRGRNSGVTFRTARKPGLRSGSAR